MDATDIRTSNKCTEVQNYCARSGDSSASAAANFVLKVIQEESYTQTIKETIAEKDEDIILSETPSVAMAAPSSEKMYKRMLRRIIGVEQPEKMPIDKVLHADQLETDNPLAAGYLKIKARFCLNLRACIKGTLIATIESIVFSALNEYEQPVAFCQSPIEMRYENVRSVGAYRDASVFVFTKRPRFLRQNPHDSSVEDGDQPSSFPDDMPSLNAVSQNKVEPLTLRESEVFLCCVTNRSTSGGPASPTWSTSGAQWFIVSRKRMKDLDNFLTGNKLGFVSVVPWDDASNKTMGEKNVREDEKSINISSVMESLSPRRMTLQFKGLDFSNASSQSYLSRSFGRLLQRTVSARCKTALAVSERRRPLSMGCSEELFCDHTAIEAIPPDSRKTDNGTSSATCDQSSCSTPSFADEKEVFDSLRQSSLTWELVSEQELLQRCALPEADEKPVNDDKAMQWKNMALLPDSPVQSRILTNQAQIQELFEAIPMGAQSFEWSLTFSTELHGFSLKTLYRRCEDFVNGDLQDSVEPCSIVDDFDNKTAFWKHRGFSAIQRYNQPCILLVRATNDCLMGAYLSCHPRLSSGEFYGTGESFVFHWTSPAASTCENIWIAESTELTSTSKGLCFKKYPWSMKNSFFISGEPDVLTIGCSDACSALRIDASLDRGRSQICETFDNNELTSSGDFFIHTVELWSLS